VVLGIVQANGFGVTIIAHLVDALLLSLDGGDSPSLRMDALETID